MPVVQLAKIVNHQEHEGSRRSYESKTFVILRAFVVQGFAGCLLKLQRHSTTISVDFSSRRSYNDHGQRHDPL
jgi:hypothetical protein